MCDLSCICRDFDPENQNLCMHLHVFFMSFNPSFPIGNYSTQQTLEEHSYKTSF